MYRNRRGDYGARGGRRRRWPRSRAAGCLLWIVLLVVLLIVLAVLFGGFQKGTRVNGMGPGMRTGSSMAAGRGADARGVDARGPQQSLASHSEG
jgi:hypothetical protein